MIKQQIDLLSLRSWFDANLEMLQQKGFSLSYQYSREYQTVKTHIISIEKCNYEASVTLWETGDCNFLVVDMEVPDEETIESATTFTQAALANEEDLKAALTTFFDDLEELKCK